MPTESLPDCLRLLRLLRDPHTVVCLARRMKRCTKSVRRDIARLRRVGFRILDNRPHEGAPKKYTAIDPVRDFQTIMRKHKP